MKKNKVDKKELQSVEIKIKNAGKYKTNAVSVRVQPCGEQHLQRLPSSDRS